jgi:hypothetical protein
MFTFVLVEPLGAGHTDNLLFREKLDDDGALGPSTRAEFRFGLHSSALKNSSSIAFSPLKLKLAPK